MQLKPDCRHFKGDRPCTPHKTSGVTCDTCDQFEAVSDRTLIVKLDAMGDVLRTTSILRPLLKKFVRTQITWITQPESRELFAGITAVDRVVTTTDPILQNLLLVEKFNRVINLDASPKSCLIASSAQAQEWIGFRLKSNGQVECSNDAARHWLEMGAFDPVKKANTKTYQQIMLEILGLDANQEHPVLWQVSENEHNFAKNELQRLGLNLTKRIVGLNTGASPRWKQKKWTLEGFQGLVSAFSGDDDLQLLLLGGPHEKDRNKALVGSSKNIFLARTDYSVREFASLMSQVDVVVTGDTMAVHLAAALGRRIVALFGPTSVAEIELYGLGQKIFPEMDCLCCYLPDCDVEVKCMERITVAQVEQAIRKELALIRS